MLIVVAGLAVLVAAGRVGRAQSSLFDDNAIPFGRSPIDYYGEAADNAVASLGERLMAGRQKLAFEPGQGYLRSLLEALEIPVESQVLVFSKSSLNQQLVSPQNPRAIYFNDDVYVAYVPGAAALEISAIDRGKGTLFYTLLQTEHARPQFHREERCVVCHASQSTLQAPGQMLKSFETTETGKLVSGYSRVTHDTPYEKRWGGWYVTGSHGRMAHRGNLVGPADFERHGREPDFGGNVAELKGRFDTSPYLTPHSDIVALLVLDHQVHFQNLCIRLGMLSRLGLATEEAVEQLVRYMLFAEAPPLPDKVRGSSGFAEHFERRQPDKAKLRRLNLTDRLLEGGLSFQVQGAAFQALPQAAREQVDRRLEQVLCGDEGPDWLPKSRAERRQMWRRWAAVDGGSRR